jgi:hypothetical protein
MHALVCVTLAAGLVAQTPKFIPGVWVSTPEGPVELIAFADLRADRTLAMTSGTLEDVPTIRPHAWLRVLTSLPNWTPQSVIVSSTAIFSNPRAERRSVTISGRKLNVYSHELRIVDLESEQSAARLFKDVRASAATPMLAVVVMDSLGVRRYYPLRLALPPQ